MTEIWRLWKLSKHQITEKKGRFWKIHNVIYWDKRIIYLKTSAWFEVLLSDRELNKNRLR